MELFSLLAKLTLDTTEYDRGVSRLQGQEIDGGEVSVGLDHREYDAGVESVTAGSESFGEHVGNIFDNIKKGLEAAGIVAVITKVGQLLKDCVTSTISMADEVDKGSKRMTISTRSYQLWNYALGQSGGNVTDLSRGIRNLRNELGNSTEVTEAEAKALKELGIDAAGKTREELRGLAKDAIAASNSTQDHTEAVKTLNSLLGENEEEAQGVAGALGKLHIDPSQYKTTEELLEATLRALAQIKDEDERGVLATAIFGPNTGGLMPLLAAGEEGLDQLLDRADELGLVMSDQEIQNAVELGDAVDDLKQEIQAVKSSFIADIIPYLKDAVGMITNVVKFFNGRATNNSLANKFSEIDKTMKESYSQIARYSSEAQTLVDKLWSMGDYTKLSKEEQALWNARAERALEIMPDLAGYIDIDTHSLKGNTDEIKENIRQWERRERVKALETAMEQKREALAESAVELSSMEVEVATMADKIESSRKVMLDEMNAVFGDERVSAIVAKTLGKSNFTEEDFASGAYNFDVVRKFYENNFSSTDTYKDAKKDLEESQTDLLLKSAELTKKENEFAEKEAEFNAEYAAAQKLIASEEAEEAEQIDELTKGIDKATTSAKNLGKTIDDIPDEKQVTLSIVQDFASGAVSGFLENWFHHAKGADIVPWDNYPALLHRDEMVLTASQARRYREGDTGVDLTGLRSEIVAAIREGMADATVNSYLDGQAVTDTVSRRLAAEVAGRRFG